MKKTSLFLASILALSTASALASCGEKADVTLNVWNWEEYIDEGGIDGYDYEYNHKKSKAVYKQFSDWYKEKTGVSVKVNYVTFETNEELYNKVKLGNSFDLACPSDYMIMKLAAENQLAKYSTNFFDKNNEENYYINNVSPYIESVFENGKVSTTNESWAEYAAGYMWGTTGLVYNPDKVDVEDLTTWAVLKNSKYKNKLTSKDNIRDSYFAALAIYHENELKTLKSQFDNGELSASEYNARITEYMNDTTPTTIKGVEEVLNDVKKNIYSFETDQGKEDFITGKININFAWSGDAVFAMNEMNDSGIDACYAVPETASNLWFDGWVMSKKVESDTAEGALNKQTIAEAFVNYISMPQNAIKNSYYVGYSTAIAGEEMFEYMSNLYDFEEGTVAVEYDVSYFFGEGHKITTDAKQLTRQLFAQYPTEEVINHCAVMGYYNSDINNQLNEMWTKIKG